MESPTNSGGFFELVSRDRAIGGFQGSSSLETKLEIMLQSQPPWPHSYSKGLRGPYRYQGPREHLPFRSLPHCLEETNLNTSRRTPVLQYIQAGRMPPNDIQETPAPVEHSDQRSSIKRKKHNIPRTPPHSHANLTTPQLQRLLQQLLRDLRAPHHPSRRILQVA